MMYRYSCILVMVVCGAWGASAIFNMDSPRMEIAGGKLRGKYVLTKENKRVRAFMGIPYAKPPVGELRFKSPEPPDAWNGERWSVDIPVPCIQAERRHGEPIGKEDCLYLNVFTPENIEKRIMAQMNLTESKNSTKAKGNSTNTDLTSAKLATEKNTSKVNETMSNDILDNTIDGTLVGGTILNTKVGSGNATVGNATVGNATTNGNNTKVNETTPEPPPRMCLPVMVFLHGGGFETGSSSPFTHEYLLDTDIVLVAVQYRLGLLGFLSTGDTVLPGNLGLKDQRLALQWVRENIEKFGGCPEKVTIVGDGAGGASVHYHLLFAQPKNESFRAGISMSGTALSPWAFRPPTEVAHMVDSLSKITHCPRESEAFLACMWNLRAEDFVLILQKYKNETLGGCGEWALSLPVVGGVMEDCRVEDAFITANPWDKKVSIPWMVGVTSKEMLYEFTEQLVDRRNRAFPHLESCFNDSLPNALGYTFSNASSDKLVENIRKFYFKEEPISRDIFADLVEAVSDGSVVYPTFEAVRRAGRRSTWLYSFNYIGSNTYGPSALDGRIAPGRGDDLFYFFPRPLGKNVPRKSKEPDMVISKKLVSLWTNFVIHLDPTPAITPDGVKWAPVAPSTTFLNIGQSVMVVERPFCSYRMNFWSMEDFPHRDDDYGDGLCLKTEEPEVEEVADEIPMVLPDDFYPALKWTLKNGWKPLVDAADDLKDEKLEEVKNEEGTTTTAKPTLVPEVYDDSFYPALRWTLKAGWRPLVDTVGNLSVVDDEGTDEKAEEVTTTTAKPTLVPEVYDDSFYPALRWTLKAGWRPLVDTVGNLSVVDDEGTDEKAEEVTTTTAKPTLVPEVYDDSFYPALRWTLKAGWRPLVDTVGNLSVVDDEGTDEKAEEVTTTTAKPTLVPEVYDDSFYPALRWTLKAGWRPLVDTVGNLSVVDDEGTDEKAEEVTTTTAKPTLVPEVYDDSFYPALRWTLKAGWRPLVDTVGNLSVVDDEGTDEKAEEVTTTTAKPTLVPEVYDDSFYPALRWTLKAGWRPLVDTVGNLSVVDDEGTDEKAEEVTTTTAKPTLVPEVNDDSFYPALRWTLKAGWRPLVDTVGDLSNNEITTSVVDDEEAEEVAEEEVDDGRVVDLCDG